MEAGIPLARGTAGDAAAIRGVLQRARFTEQAICERLHLTALDSVDQPLFKSYAGRMIGAGPLEVLARLFVFGERVAPESLGGFLSDAELDAFTRCDLIRPWPAADWPDAFVFCPVRLVPIAGWGGGAANLLLAGDRADCADGSPFVPFEDIVFSGHNALTRQFVRLLPRAPRESLLDLCSGTGVAALAMSSSARRCVAADLAERSVHFARFNAWLNDVPGVEVVCGDLYDPVRGRRFDRIVAHPPYVPALTHTLTYRDGGETGDEIVQRIIAGVPQHLDEGGTFHVLCLGMDTADRSVEQRVRGWLGDAQAEFDIVFAVDSRTPPEVIATKLVAGGSPHDLERWRAMFENLKVKEFVYGAIAGRRFTPAGDGDAFTRRVLLEDETTGESFDRLFHWFDWLRLPGREARLLDSRPRLAADLRLEVRHDVEGGTFVPAGYTLTNGGHPFRARLETGAWVVALLSELDGSCTVRERYRSAAERGRIPANVGEADVAQMVSFLMERGCLAAP